MDKNKGGRPSIESIKTREDLLNYRMEHWNKNNSRNSKSEALFCDFLEANLMSILKMHGYEPSKISREFILTTGRLDFLIKLNTGEYIIIEVKHSNEKVNNELMFSFALGQLLTYSTAFSNDFNIKKERIKLMLITDADSLLTLATINDNKLNIDFLVVGSEVVKYYGSK